MGWKAIKSLNKQEHIERETAAGVIQPVEVPLEEPKNALRELPASETFEVITGPGGWMIGVPVQTSPEEPQPETTILPDLVSVTEAPLPLVVEETTPVKKPSGKKKKAVEPT
jgi:hypothetical protein